MAAPGLRLEHFTPDEPFDHMAVTAAAADRREIIDGVSVTALTSHQDSRGSLCELLTTRDDRIEPIVHVYQVTAEAGSRRAWVYHRRQHDRLAYPNGRFRLVLYDIRPESPTFGMLNVFDLGSDHPGLVTIPPCVIHGVHNMGREAASFINMPTNVWDPGSPDKFRLPIDDPRIPFSFDD